MYSHYESQKKEIETIKPRQLEIKLSDADVLRIAEKAGAHGLTVSQLIENFIGDLVGGTYTNGSDERMYAQQWFERCWFSMFPDMTFLRYLTEWGGLEYVLELWDDLQDAKNDIAYYEEHPDEPEPGEVEEIRAVLQDSQEQIDGYWNEYCQLKTEYKRGTLEEEMKKVLEWQAEYKRLAGE